MELKEIENWTYEKFDHAINFNKTEITKLESEIKKLREVKSKKTMEDSLAMITDSGIDFSLEDLQAFLQSKKNAANENRQTKKPIVEEVASVAEEIPVVEEVAPVVEEILAVEKVAPVVEEIPAVEEVAQDKKAQNDVTPIIAQEQNADDILNNPTAEEIFEDAVPVVNSHSAEYKTIAQSLGLPENTSVAEIRQIFDINKNSFPPSIADNFEEMISKMERGEIV